MAEKVSAVVNLIVRVWVQFERLTAVAMCTPFVIKDSTF